MVDVLKYRYVTAFISASIFIAFLSVGIYRRIHYGAFFEYSVDFEGGTQILLRSDKTVSGAVVRDALERAGRRGVVTREFTDNEFLVRIKEVVADAKEVAQEIIKEIATAYPDTNFQLLQSDVVGSSVGEAMRGKSLLAALLGLLIMLIYIAIRFWSVSFGLGALISLFHDAVVVLLVFMLLGREVSTGLITAVLTVLGYSINDTIVIFSAIRENLTLMKGRSLSDIVTVSINNTLRRTLLTSFATALTVLAMLILGGEALRDLSIALFAGIFFGTYSSIYIASPVMMLFHTKEKHSA